MPRTVLPRSEGEESRRENIGRSGDGTRRPHQKDFACQSCVGSCCLALTGTRRRRAARGEPKTPAFGRSALSMLFVPIIDPTRRGAFSHLRVLSHLPLLPSSTSRCPGEAAPPAL